MRDQNLTFPHAEEEREREEMLSYEERRFFFVTYSCYWNLYQKSTCKLQRFTYLANYGGIYLLLKFQLII